MKTQILELRQQNLSYNEIAKILNCNKSTVSYHLGKGVKSKKIRNQRNRRHLTDPSITKCKKILEANGFVVNFKTGVTKDCPF